MGKGAGKKAATGVEQPQNYRLRQTEGKELPEGGESRERVTRLPAWKAILRESLE